MDIAPYEGGGFYVMDKAYIDFARLYAIHLQKSFFVTPAKDNLRFKRIYSRLVDKAKVSNMTKSDGSLGIIPKGAIPKKSAGSSIMTSRPKRNSSF